MDIHSLQVESVVDHFPLKLRILSKQGYTSHTSREGFRPHLLFGSREGFRPHFLFGPREGFRPHFLFASGL